MRGLTKSEVIIKQRRTGPDHRSKPDPI